MYCMSMATYIYLGMPVIEYNDPVTLTLTFLMLLSLNSKCVNIRPLLAI